MSTQGKPDELANAIIARHESLKGERGNWDVAWDDVARYILPRKGQILTKTAPGQEQTTQLYDTTAEESVLIGAAGLLSQLVPPGEPWMRYEPADPQASEESKEKFAKATDRVLKAIYASNFYLAIHEDFIDALGFCTSNTYVEEGTKRLLNFVNIPVGTFCVAEDNEGMVDTVYREWQWTAKQIEQQWPDVTLPEEIAKCLGKGSTPKDWDKKFTIIQAVYPRRRGQWKQGRVEGALREYADVYVCKECKGVILESGFYERPFAVSRLLRSNNEAYGRGPGLSVMPEIKMLNRAELDLILAIETEVNPPWLMPEDGASRPDNRPNGVTYWDATNPNGKPERIKSTARVDWAEMWTEKKRARIRSAFFVDMFQMLNAPGVKEKEMTAREVAERIREKLVLFSPMFARLVQEKLNPLLERVFNIMLRQGQFDDLGFEEGEAYEIAYTSKIALALKAANDTALLELVDIAALLQPFDQRVGMMVDWAKAFRDTCQNRGMSATNLRTIAEVDKMMAQMQQAQQAMQAAQMAESVTGSIKNLGPDAQKQAMQAVA
jgi:hypothetical protein